MRVHLKKSTVTAIIWFNNKQNIDMIGGGHFLQDGCGNQLVQEIIRFIRENPVSDKQTSNYVIPKL